MTMHRTIAQRTELDPTCVVGPAPPSAARAQQAPWLHGLLARSHGLRALVLRGPPVR